MEVAKREGREEKAYDERDKKSDKASLMIELWSSLRPQVSERVNHYYMEGLPHPRNCSELCFSRN